MAKLIKKLLTWSTIRKAFKFGTVGGITTITGLIELYFLTSILHIFYLDSAVITTFIGFTQNFVGNVLNGNIPLEDLTEEKK